jgi:hypothetical protein
MLEICLNLDVSIHTKEILDTSKFRQTCDILLWIEVVLFLLPDASLCNCYPPYLMQMQISCGKINNEAAKC